MTENRFSFTAAKLNKLPVPEKGKRRYYYDTKVQGLGVAITGMGTKTFIVYRKINAKPERITLGRFPDVPLDEARAQAFEVNAAIARGENPNDKRRRIREEWTLTALFERYMQDYARPHKRSWQEDEAQFQRYLQDWKNHKLSSLKKVELQNLHTRIGEEHGKYAANRLISLLHSVFEKAIEWGWDSENPVTRIKKFSEQSRTRFLQADELPRFFSALENEPNHTLKDYIWLSLLTGARRANVLAMRWQEVNLDAAFWQIPRTKNGSAQRLPLMPEAVAILKNRQQLHGQQAFVFPANSKSGHFTSPQKAWKNLLKKAEIEDLRLHDLRRSLGSWQAVTGANISVIGKTLNHKTLAATEIYARLDLDPVRQAMEVATQAMLSHRETEATTAQADNSNE
ncbi:tyrosine-type recombinase/integrase [Candidatus Venteria ishoeyi]|uniref:Prophage CP4-57 integrase n=1 Tax=Candidatus Venteria ishoeyi TaxID=1899563 RepID=A0A1H6F4C6_9GAMM|nr:site-specific integrase [Candidatus Venteria ishoeyi]SEH04980.1 Prophage CP4-57 integrase [Candidatus Venteria ishoeyi]